ncbi:aminopeptidase [Fictibacillus enclensis]|uniref:aminopeptidase n=1 Tax=Fictibacillus enclensis TaxID=1017270 RepID=UPI0025A28D81|nr:aminopeptidase [Fictibacillus enclensis]MDM5197576.1 aminopeptidase [Fictibacillus enclensis]MDM5336741.1 aminopeptidase [Fictibacillus enclensis]
MIDQRVVTLAKTLLHHSVQLKKGERVLITSPLTARPLIKALIEEAYAMGAYPYVNLYDDEINRYLYTGYEAEQLETSMQWDLKRVKEVDAYISISSSENDAELSDVPGEKFRLRGEYFKPVQKVIINDRKWVLLNYPTQGLAQKAKMSYEAFTNFLLDVCNVDYEKMDQAQQPLKELMERSDRVRIVSPGTDLTFSIKGIPAVKCAGENNIPDGEVFTAPVKDSVNGTITYNTPCPYRGTVFNNVSLTFKDGKIVEATADNSDKINEIFETDEGARFVGEFAIGVNPMILHPMGDILFDEKIAGSIHFTPGEAYEDADNGNRSSVHWDMVLIQRPEYGGGELYFDDVLVRKDGLFVLPELEGLNPQHLK